MLALILAAQLAAAPTPSTPPAIEVVAAQLAGCWEQSLPNGRTVEMWMRNDSGMALGMSRTVRDGRVTEYEFLMLRQNPTGVDYVAQPSGQPTATFALKAFGDDATVFENLAHDFPQRIIYRWPDRDTMIARIEGQMGGQAKGVDFTYKRCPTGN